MRDFATVTWSLAPVLAVAVLIAALATLHLWLVPLLLRIETRARHRAEDRRRRAAMRFAADVTATIQALPTRETR